MTTTQHYAALVIGGGQLGDPYQPRWLNLDGRPRPLKGSTWVEQQLIGTDSETHITLEAGKQLAAEGVRVGVVFMLGALSGLN